MTEGGSEREVLMGEGGGEGWGGSVKEEAETFVSELGVILTSRRTKGSLNSVREAAVHPKRDRG